MHLPVSGRTVWLSWFLGLALFWLTPAARAQDDATVEMARQRFHEGVQFYDQHQYEKARLAFLQAYTLKAHPAILLNLAQSELRSGHPEDAATHFTAFIGANSGSDSERQDAQNGLSTAKGKVGEVTVSSDVQGAQISVDGQDKGQTPLAAPLFVTPGTHTFEARSGDRHASKTIATSAGQSASVTLGLRPSASAPVAAATAGEASEAAAPTEQSTVEEPQEKTEPKAEPAEPPPERRERKPFFQWFGETPIAWVGAGLTVGGLAGGVIFGLTAKHDYDAANSVEAQTLSFRDSDFKAGALASANSAPCNLSAQDIALLKSHGLSSRIQDDATACKVYGNDVNLGNQAKTAATIFGVVGGVALAGTIVYYFLDPNAEEPASSAEPATASKARFVPVLSPSMAGVIAVGAF